MTLCYYIWHLALKYMTKKIHLWVSKQEKKHMAKAHSATTLIATATHMQLLYKPCLLQAAVHSIQWLNSQPNKYLPLQLLWLCCSAGDSSKVLRDFFLLFMYLSILGDYFYEKFKPWLMVKIVEKSHILIHYHACKEKLDAERYCYSFYARKISRESGVKQTLLFKWMVPSRLIFSAPFLCWTIIHCRVGWPNRKYEQQEVRSEPMLSYVMLLKQGQIVHPHSLFTKYDFVKEIDIMQDVLK